MSNTDHSHHALVVVDVQTGFDGKSWGPRNNLDCDANIARLLHTWTEQRRPIVYVRHDALDRQSPLHPTNPGTR